MALHNEKLAISEISDQIGFKLSPEDVTWVITVPAIWSEGAKAFMRQAAIETTLVIDKQLYIALEPEVASLYCRKTYHQEQSKKLNIELSICLIQAGTNYVIIDAGGGSVDSIEDKFKSTHCPKGLRYSSKLGIIRIDSSLMLQLFAAVVEPMRRHIKREINSLLVSRSVKYAFLVGGFAQSTVLRDRLKLALEPETQLIIAPSPHLAVLHGAALFGLNPEVIRMRRASRTYGIAVFDRFDPRKHPFDAKITVRDELGKIVKSSIDFLSNS
ncbi:Heat shock 70 kDa protein 12A [Tyrophagus putrescentiae]|nr:Heat shock 70 kDa protein 12A [Tyrophagus putrescentiae]